jgi:UDP-2,3-diacylglucosamine hydrolase
LLLQINIPAEKKIYFASDFHLGADEAAHEARTRENKVCRWLEQIKADAYAVFLVGDLFDFWFEYIEVIPKGFSRFMGTVAKLADNGVKIYIFKGNHDSWQLNYLKEEWSAEIIEDSLELQINQKTFFIAHGDGYGPGDEGYKRLKVLFRSRISNFLFRYILPADLGMYLGKRWASHSWNKHKQKNDVYVFSGLEKEFLYNYCLEAQKHNKRDFYIFGHRHFVFNEALPDTGKYINLGDWIRFCSYAEFDGDHVHIKYFEQQI